MDTTPHDSQSQTNEQTSTQEGAVASTGSSSNKKPLYIIGAVIVLLLVVLIGLVIVLINKKDTSSNTTQSANSSQSSDSSASDSNKQEIVKTVATNDPKLEILIYKPTQNPSYTTINFGVRNKCSGCSGTTSSASPVIGYDSATSSYLLDDQAGKKYSAIKDDDGNVLASPSCNKWIKYNEASECFVSFSKVPSGSTISWVFGNTRIDGIKIP